jgi:hypothetical protein
MSRALIWITVAGCIEYKEGALLGPPDAADVPEGSILEDFDGGGTSSVDVIVFADTSGSMTEELKTLGKTITPFVDRLASRVDDWQLAAVTGDTGCTISGILTPQTNDYASKFANAVTQYKGSDDAKEMALQNVTLVVEKSGKGKCNEGLVRGGSLQIVFVSDENDESPGYDESPDYWKDWVDRIDAVNGDASRVKMSAVTGPTPYGCHGADPGFGYDKVVSATNGQSLSICDDWASQINIIADSVGVRDTFPLSDQPVPESIQVWVNEVPVPPANFDYDPAANAVKIATPAGPDDKVQIEYQLA